MKLIVNIVKIHTEHSYVQHPIFGFEDNDHKVFNQLLKIFSKLLIPFFYKNHFVLECVDYNNNTYYIGYNDNKVNIGTKMDSLNDSKVIEVISNNVSIIRIS